MSHSRQTEHYELPLYNGTDIINPLTDFNNANETIDEAVYNANQRSVQAEQTAENAKDIAEGYDTRVTQAIDTANGAMTLANNTQDMIADDFDPMKEGGYKVGDFVIYNGKLYRFINAHTGAWDASDVQVSPVLIEAIGEVVDEGKQAIDEAVADAEEEIAGQTEKVTKTQAMIAQPFDENKVGGYAVDDVVTYADKLYKFTSAHSGAWTGLDVEQTDVAEKMAEVDEVKNALTWKKFNTPITTNEVSLPSANEYLFIAKNSSDVADGKTMTIIVPQSHLISIIENFSCGYYNNNTNNGSITISIMNRTTAFITSAFENGTETTTQATCELYYR